MEIMLSKEGYNVDTTTSGLECVSKLRQVDFDLVIADLNMPEISGLEVLQQIKGFKSEQEIIVMTAFASVDTAIEAMKSSTMIPAIPTATLCHFFRKAHALDASRYGSGTKTRNITPITCTCPLLPPALPNFLHAKA